MSPTSALAQTPLFQTPTETLPFSERVKISYDRAKAIMQVYNLTVEDILHVSNKYWQFHTDPILIMDGAVGTLLTIHCNLCIGTLAMFAKSRPDIQAIIDDLLRYRVSGQFCLTELGHGLDAISLETTATLLPSGEFDLHTPTPQAAKYMPPTGPCGIPCVAVVFAKLIVGGRNHGIKPFVVWLSDGEFMNPGISAKCLTPRGGSHPVAHALTYFDHIRLPSTAILGDLKKPFNPRTDFFYNISRVISGTLSMGAFAVAALRAGAYVAAKYSVRRHVSDAVTGSKRPIISFSTQYIPITKAISQALVLQCFAQWAHGKFTQDGVSLSDRHLIAAIFKTTAFKHNKDSLLALGDRCGAQGLFEANQLAGSFADMRGAAIAEGDILGISIRFAVEICLGRVKCSLPKDPQGLLAQHEQGLLDDLRAIVRGSANHRNAKIERSLLPHCQPIIEAIGNRYAYEAAVAHGLPRHIVDLFVATVIEEDPAWYSENTGLPRNEQKALLLEAATSTYHNLEEALDMLDVESYIYAPMVSDERWNRYVEGLRTLGAPKVMHQVNLTVSARL